LGLPLAIPFALTILSSFGAVLAVILSASSIGNEYNWRTIRIALISGEGRLKFLGAKFVSFVILIVIGMLIGLATGFIMSLITTAIGGHPFDFSFITGSYLWEQFLQFWRTFFVLMPFMLLGSIFAIVGRSAMPGISIGIGILFLEPIITSFMGLAGGWVAKIPDYLFNANVNAINSLNKLPLPGGFSGAMVGSSSHPPSVTHAFVVLSVYIVVFVVAAFYVFRRRDVTG
jgi:ABC-2 type transport system permease protein